MAKGRSLSNPSPPHKDPQLPPQAPHQLPPIQSPLKALQICSQILPISDHFTFTPALKACSLLHSPIGLAIDAHIIKTSRHSNLFTHNSPISFYSSVSDPRSARKAFDEISEPDVVSWTLIVSAFVRNGRERDALFAFGSMDVRPNALTLVSALSACSGLKDDNLRKSGHGHGLRNVGGIGSNIILDNAILKMYGRCWELGSACHMFEVMPYRDVVSWTTAISGMHGTRDSGRR